MLAAAVLLVFIDHAKRAAFTGGFLSQIGSYGQEAVAVFFVLSGLVVSHSASKGRHTFRTYMLARLSRLWSVVLPAILLTVCLDVIGRAIDPLLYAEARVPAWEFDLSSAWRALSPALFLNAVPPFSVEVGSNGPFWSLSYEGWYYVAFGIAFFLKGGWRIVGLSLIVCLAGPNIRALAPIWLMGVAIRSQLGRQTGSGTAWLGWIGSIAGILLLLAFKYRLGVLLDSLSYRIRVEGLNGSTLVEKYGIPILVCINIICFDRISNAFTSILRPVRFINEEFVARSFSIYLYQAPLLFFFAAMSHDISNYYARIFILYAGTLTACVVLSNLTERQTSRTRNILNKNVARALP